MNGFAFCAGAGRAGVCGLGGVAAVHRNPTTASAAGERTPLPARTREPRPPGAASSGYGRPDADLDRAPTDGLKAIERALGPTAPQIGRAHV